MKPWQKRREKQKLKNRTNVVCLECGASFTILKSLVKYGGAKYCSRVCYDTARSKQSKSLLGYIDGYPVYEGSRRYAFISLGARGQYRVALQRYLMEKSMGR